MQRDDASFNFNLTCVIIPQSSSSSSFSLSCPGLEVWCWNETLSSLRIDLSQVHFHTSKQLKEPVSATKQHISRRVDSEPRGIRQEKINCFSRSVKLRLNREEFVWNENLMPAESAPEFCPAGRHGRKRGFTLNHLYRFDEVLRDNRIITWPLY